MCDCVCQRTFLIGTFYTLSFFMSHLGDQRFIALLKHVVRDLVRDECGSLLLVYTSNGYTGYLALALLIRLDKEALKLHKHTAQNGHNLNGACMLYIWMQWKFLHANLIHVSKYMCIAQKCVYLPFVHTQQHWVFSIDITDTVKPHLWPDLGKPTIMSQLTFREILIWSIEVTMVLSC